MFNFDYFKGSGKKIQAEKIISTLKGYINYLLLIELTMRDLWYIHLYSSLIILIILHIT